MSSYRQIHTKIWKDDWFLDLEPMHKLFFIYLFSNERASLAGIYELPMRVMSFESGLTMPEIKSSFGVFSEARKAFWENGVVWIPNLRKYHETKSDTVQKRIMKDLNDVKDCELKDIYCEIYGIDTLSDRVSIPSITSIYTSTSTSKKGGVGENKPKRKPKPKKPQQAVVIPDNFNTPEFLSAWNDFKEHRKEIKSKMTPRAESMQLKALSAHAPQVAIKMLQASIANGWKGVFPLKNGHTNGHSNYVDPTTVPNVSGRI